MEPEKTLDRIRNVYQESLNAPNKTEQTEDTNIINIHPQSIYSNHINEIDGNYLLYFNEIYTSTIGKLLKNILKKLTWHILKRQVYFNSSIKFILYDLLQKNHEHTIKDIERNENFTQIEQRVKQLNQLNSQLEQKVEQLNQLNSQLEQKVERLPQLEQKIERLPKIEQKLERLPQLEQKVEERLPQLEQHIEQLSQLEQKVEKQLLQLEQQVEQISAELNADNNVTREFASAEEAKIKSGLWFNDPIWVGHRDNGEAYWVETTERIIEKTFVIHSLASLYVSKQIEILDVGAAESLLSYELASFNYSVTAIDIRPIALFHPNLKFVKTDICKPVLPPASFDCVIALSTLEHIGLGWYGDETGESYDLEAVKQINILLKPEGHFILTVPYGKKALTPVHRIYDKEALQRLIQDFIVTEIVYGVRKDDFTWILTENELEASVQEHNPNNYLPGAVAMLVCKKNIS